MEGLAVVGFVFGLAAFVRVEKLIRGLKKRDPGPRLQRRVIL